MALVIAGIDEAGYGPLLGPLCVGLAVLRVERWHEGDPAPDMWELLGPQVSRETDRRGTAIAVADSKKLKLANDTSRSHPCMHLERGVHAFLSNLSSGGGRAPADDAQLLSLLGCSIGGHKCYAGAPVAMPLGWTADQLAIASSMLAGALARAGVSVLDLRCRAVPEPDFNDIVRATGSKGETTLAAIGEHLRACWSKFAGGPDPVRVVCDRLGGRTMYASVLKRAVAPADATVEVRVLEESDRRSRYMIEGTSGRMGVAFHTEGEQAHLPVALASMIAKLVRELAMARFNRYWSDDVARVRAGVELKPTAGYAQDAKRWLKDAKPLLTEADRAAIVRRA